MNQVTTPHANGTAASKAYHRRAAAPSVDVFENADELLIVADVPGVGNDGLDLQVDAVVSHAGDVGDDEQLVGALEDVDRGGGGAAMVGLGRGGSVGVGGRDLVHDSGSSEQREMKGCRRASAGLDRDLPGQCLAGLGERD